MIYFAYIILFRSTVNPALGQTNYSYYKIPVLFTATATYSIHRASVKCSAAATYSSTEHSFYCFIDYLIHCCTTATPAATLIESFYSLDYVSCMYC